MLVVVAKIVLDVFSMLLGFIFAAVPKAIQCKRIDLISTR